MSVDYNYHQILLPVSVPTAGMEAHPTTLPLFHPRSTEADLTTLITFKGNETWHSLWGGDEYQPVTNRDQLQVFLFVALL